MEAVTSAAIESVKSVIKFAYSRIKTISKHEENIRELHKEMENLVTKRLEIQEDVTLAKLEGKEPKQQVNKWLADALEAEDDARPLLELPGGRYQKCYKVVKILNRLKELGSTYFESVAVERCSIKPVEEMAVPPLVGRNVVADMNELLKILKMDDVTRIGVLGKGGIGKTTLVKHLNNELSNSSGNWFDVVIWVQVSMASDLSLIQSQITKRIRLKVEAGDPPYVIANGIHQRLKANMSMNKKILVILDDVWEKIDLDVVGIPSRDRDCKILLTTRSYDVCRHMAVDFSLTLNLMSEEDAWNLFVQSAGPVLNLDGIESPARKIVAGFNGLPLAIKTLGKSMRDRPQIELWRNACLRWRCSSPLFKNIENEVFGTLAMSYHSLPSKVLKQCFLYCSMYTSGFSIDVRELIHCWVSDGLINENQTEEEAFNYGVALVEHLKDSCLLDHDTEGTVKMHDIFRHLAVLLSRSEEMYGFHCQLSLPFYQTPNESSRRVSFMGCRIKKLQEFPVNSQPTVLFLQGNPIQKIQTEYFNNLKPLRVLNLSETRIMSLPSSFLCLGELRSLSLRDSSIQKLPSLENLCELLFLDLSNTRIRELPKGIESLHKLRELNLSSTHFLKKILAGGISGLASLETLDMSFSAYNWNPKRGATQIATFQELLSLDRLSALLIRLDSVECLASASTSSWLKKLRRFDVQISPRSLDSNGHVPKRNEKRLVLRGVDFLQEDLHDILNNTSSLDMLTCVGMAQRHWLSLSSLISLTISNCDDITRFINTEKSSREMFPNLQHLVLDRLKSLKITVEGIHPRGKCLSNLKTIQVSDCPLLKEAISYAMLRHVRKLEEIKVSGCDNMSCVIESGEHEETLPNLRVLEASNMVNLSAICDGTSVYPSLERIDVLCCLDLKKLPLSISNLSRIKEIRGDIRWWNGLRWEDDDTKRAFLQHFQAYPMENCSRKRKYK